MLLDGEPIYGRGIDPVAIRRRIGMVFQRSNPFPKTIIENVAYGLRIGGMSDAARDRRRGSSGPCVQAALWDEVKDRLERQRAGRCRAASSSACASRARWRWSPRCC